jgi:hypothetical protein
VRSTFRAIFSFLLVAWMIGNAGCAKIGPPLPPEVLTPKAASDLTAHQVADRIVLSVSLPELNTNGTRALTISYAEVFKAMVDRQDGGPLPEAAFLDRAERMISIPAGQFGNYLSGGRLEIPDPSFSDPRTFYSRGFRFAVRFVNKHNQTAGLSNQAFAAPVALPLPPEGLSSAVLSDRILLTWKTPERNDDGSAPARIAGYQIFRTQDPASFPTTPLNGALLSKPEYEDRDFEFDQTYYYRIVVVGNLQNPLAESLPTPTLAVAPKDTFPPGMPRNLFCGVQNNIVTLLWEPPGDGDVAGFRIFRKAEGEETSVLLQEDLLDGFSFRDEKAVSGRKYEYGVVAVDTHRNAGAAAVIQVEVR